MQDAPSPDPPVSTSWIVAAFVAVYLIWGSTYLGIKIAVETTPPLLMASFRFVVSGAILYAAARWSGAAKPTLAEWKSTAIIGTFLLLGGNGLVAIAQKVIDSGLSSVIVAGTPFWMTLFDWVRKDGRKPSFAVVCSLIIGFAGTAVLVYDPTGNISLLGVGALLLASISWAYGSIYSRQAVLPQSPILTTGMEMLAGSLVLFVVGMATGEHRGFDVTKVSANSVLAIVYLIFFGSLIGFTAYLWLLRVCTPAKVSTYAYVNPIVAVFLGWSFGDEAISLWTLGACGIIIAAVAVLTIARSYASASDEDVAKVKRPIVEENQPPAVMCAPKSTEG